MPDPGPKRDTQPDQAETQVSFTETPTRVKGSTSGKPPAEFLAALAERYEVLKELGQGGMGVVYQARDLETQEIVALKLLKPEIAHDQDLMERFRNELRLARKITHKNVCRTHELLRFGETYVISMEYVEGDSLRHVLNRFGGLPFKKAIQLAGEVCAGLAEAHAQGVVHRDLKPENVMLDLAGTAKVMDFGIARSFSADLSTAGGVIGTPDYMSPEQAESKSVDARTDVYLVGLLLYEIFTGERAFTGDTPVAVVLKQIKEAPPAPSLAEPAIPRHVENVILRCLEKDPAKRFQSIAEIAKALRQERQVAAPKEVAEEVVLPLRLARWQRSDWVLLGVGVLSFAFFLPLFDAVFPYEEMRPPFSRTEAISKARRVFEKYSTVGVTDEFEADYLLYAYQQDPLGDGSYSSYARTLNRFPAWSVGRQSQVNRRDSSSVAFNQAGGVAWFSTSYANAATTSPSSVPTVTPQAILFAKDVFGVTPREAPRLFEFEPISKKWVNKDLRENIFSPYWLNDISSTPVVWEIERSKLEGRQHLLIRIRSGVAVFGAVIGESKDVYALPSKRPLRRISLLSTILILGVCLCLFFIRKLKQKTFAPVLAVSMMVSICLILFLDMVPTSNNATLQGIAYASSLVGCTLISYFVLSVPYHYLQQTLPVLQATTKNLFSWPPNPEVSGLAVIRGLLVGAMCLFLVALALWPFAYAGKAISNSGLNEAYMAERLMSSSPNFSWPFPPLVLSVIVASMALLAFPISILHRFSMRRWQVLILTCLLWSASSAYVMGSIAPTNAWGPVFAALQGLLFAIAFMRYDLLTAMTAILTFQVWMLTYPIYRIFGSIDGWVYASGIIIWATVAVLAFLLWWTPEIIGFGRRVKLALQ